MLCFFLFVFCLFVFCLFFVWGFRLFVIATFTPIFFFQISFVLPPPPRSKPLYCRDKAPDKAASWLLPHSLPRLFRPLWGGGGICSVNYEDGGLERTQSRPVGGRGYENWKKKKKMDLGVFFLGGGIDG